MTNRLWNITLRIRRQRGSGASPSWQDFPLEIDPDESVLDAVERVWAYQDRSLTFRHACHHSTCGACGMRINNVEKLTCITQIHTVTHNNGIIKVEPLRNFPIVSDLVVDMSKFFQEIEKMRTPQVVTNQQGKLEYEELSVTDTDLERLVDCIECGLCVSACPSAATDPTYMGPASLAALQQSLAAGISDISASLADDQEGAWRCHSAFECSAVCPSNVEPGYRIMDLRKKIMRQKFTQWFGQKEGDKR